MKKVTQIISLILSATLLSSVILSAPLTVSAAETDGTSDNQTVTELNGIDIGSMFEENAEPLSIPEPDTQPANSPIEQTEPPTEKMKKTVEPVAANPEITSGNFTYEKIDEKVYITSYTGAEEEVIFPATIDELPVYGIETNGRNNTIPTNTVKSIEIENGVKSIGDNAFCSLSKIEKVKLPEGLERIGKFAFGNCTALNEINFPETLTAISDYCFCDSGFTQITIPETVTEIGSGLFVGCINLKSFTVPKTWTEVPSRVFEGCQALETVTLNDGILKIGNSAFKSCKALKLINLPESITQIEAFAFFGAGLTSLTLPLHIEVIGERAFWECSINELIIPGSLKRVPDNGFVRNRLLEKVIIEEGVEEIGGAAFYECTSLKHVTFPSTLRIIELNAFICNFSLEQIELPEGLQEIQSSAFASCRSLKEIHIPDSAQKLGEYIFSSCSLLDTVTLPKTISSIPKGCFFSCTKLERIQIPEGVTKVESYAFNYCESLTKVIFPDSLVSVGASAFNSCYSLTEITLHENVDIIEEDAFRVCRNLENVQLPKSMAKLGGGVFNSCEKLTSITVPETVTEIGNGLFAFCKSLKSFTVPKAWIDIPSNLFEACQALETVNLHDGITKIGAGAFKDCKALAQIELPDSITQIGTEAFFGAGLTSLTLPSHVEVIGERPFGECSITELTIPGSWKRVPDNGFVRNQLLEKVIFEEGVEEIGGAAFYECTSLKHVTFPSTLRIIELNAFIRNFSLEQIELPEGLQEIQSFAFAECQSLKEIHIPDSAQELGEHIFFSCSLLDTVTLPNTISSIPNGTFSGCKKLEKIQIPEGVKTIGKYAFSNCDSLTNVTLPDSLVTVGINAFSYCKSLVSVIIPQNVIKLDYGAFMDCSKLKDVYANDSLDFSVGYWNWWGREESTFLRSDDVVIHCSNKFTQTARNAVNHNLAIDFNSVDRSNETEILDEENSTFSIVSGANLNFVCNYSFKPDVFDSAADKSVYVHLPVGLELIGDVLVDSIPTKKYTFDTTFRNFIIPVDNASGRISMSVKNEDADYNLRSYAALQATVDGRSVTETIDLTNEFIELMNISVDSSTSTGTVTVNGSGPKSTEIRLYVDDELSATVTSNKVGTFSADISIPNPVNTMTYFIEAKCTGKSGKEISDATYTQYNEAAPKLTWFRLKQRPIAGFSNGHGSSSGKGSTAIGYDKLDAATKDYLDNGYNLLDPNCKVRMSPASADGYYYELRFDKNEKIENVLLSTSKDGKIAYYNVFWDEKRQVYYTNTILVDYDKETEYYDKTGPSIQGHSNSRAAESHITPHLPGRLSLGIETKPIEPQINLKWGEHLSQRINALAEKTGFVKSTLITGQTDNSVSVSMQTDGGLVNGTFERCSADEFVRSHPDTAYNTIEGNYKGSLSDTSDDAIVGTETQVFNCPENKLDKLSPTDFSNSIEKNWQQLSTPDGTFYANTSIEGNSMSIKLFNPENKQMIYNTLSYASNFVGLAAGNFVSGVINMAASSLGLVWSTGTSLYTNIKQNIGEDDLIRTLRREIYATIKDPAERELANKALDKMEWLSFGACMSSIIGNVLIAGGFFVVGVAGLAGILPAICLAGCGYGLCKLADYLRDKFDEKYSSFIDILYSRSPFSWIIDPSGYVYAGLESNRISGAITTVYGIINDPDNDDETFWDSPDESRQEKWNAVEYDQMNPLITDEFGNYSWDVPEGWWKVVVEADGYDTYTTEWMKVPPPQYDVNIGLTTTNKPKVLFVDETEGIYTISFMDCMKPDSVKNLKLTNDNGNTVAFELDYTPENGVNGEELSKTFTLKIEENTYSGSYHLNIQNAENYSGVQDDISYTFHSVKQMLSAVTASEENGSALSKGTKVTLTCENSDAKIFYTLNGSDPTNWYNNAILYSDPIVIDGDTEIHAFAVCNGYFDSDVAVFHYTEKCLVGDINDDGKISIDDATLVQKAVAELIEFDSKQSELADTNKDGKISIDDATMIQKYVAELIDHLG